jgi:hypothetical protein
MDWFCLFFPIAKLGDFDLKADDKEPFIVFTLCTLYKMRHVIYTFLIYIFYKSIIRSVRIHMKILMGPTNQIFNFKKKNG